MSVNVQANTLSLKKISFSTLLIGFIVLLIYQALDAGLNKVLENLFQSSEGTPQWVWVLAALSVLLNLVFPLGISFYLMSSFKASRNWRGDFQQMMIETLRAWGKILLWTFAFVLPGLWKWLSYIFVPYIVLFSKKYQDGQVDALSLSSEVFKKNGFKTLGVTLVFSILIPLIMTSSFNEYEEIWRHPMGAVLLGLVDYVSLLISLYILFHLFIRTSHEVKNELIF